MNDITFSIILIALAIPTFFALNRVHLKSQRRSIRATDSLVTTELIRVEKEQELEINSESLMRQMAAVQRCEESIYRYLPSSSHPDQLKAVVSPQQAQEHLDNLLLLIKKDEESAAKKKKDLETHLEDRSKEIRELNRRFRKVDRFLNVSALVLRFSLALAVMYALVSVLIDLFV